MQSVGQGNVTDKVLFPAVPSTYRCHSRRKRGLRTLILRLRYIGRQSTSFSHNIQSCQRTAGRTQWDILYTCSLKGCRNTSLAHVAAGEGRVRGGAAKREQGLEEGGEELIVQKRAGKS